MKSHLEKDQEDQVDDDGKNKELRAIAEEVFVEGNFSALKDGSYVGNERTLMCEAFKTSIQLEKELITKDLIEFSQRKFFSLEISENEIEILVLNRDFKLTKKLIELNVVYGLKIAKKKATKSKRQRKLERL